VRPDGTVAGYGTGVVELARSMTVTRPVARLLARVPSRVLDGAYRVVADRRDMISGLVPDGPAPRRFP
jgi:hypothetical protein